MLVPTCLALALAGGLPDRLEIALLPLEVSGGLEVSARTRAALAILTATRSVHFGAIRVLPPELVEHTAGPRALEQAYACIGRKCPVSLWRRLGAPTAIRTRVESSKKGCIITLDWWNYRDSVTEGFGRYGPADCTHDGLRLAVRRAFDRLHYQSVLDLARLERECRPIPGLAPGYLNLLPEPPTEMFVGSRYVGNSEVKGIEVPAGCVELVARTPDGKYEKRTRIFVAPRTVHGVLMGYNRPKVE